MCARRAKITQLRNDPYLSIVIPCYNEERRLPATLGKVISYLRGQEFKAEIIVVDDGSSDHTASLVEELAATRASDTQSGDNPALRLIRNEHRGKAFAVRTGMLAADGQFVLFTDADGATPIEEVDKLLPHLVQGVDVAVGSREGREARRFGEPWHRHIMGRVFNLIVQVLAVPGIHDTQCGFKAFGRAAAYDLFSNLQLYSRDATGPVKGAMVTGFDVEILFLARKWGYRMVEVPVHWYYGTESKVNPIKDTYRNLRDVLLVRWNNLRGRYDQPPRRQAGKEEKGSG